MTTTTSVLIVGGGLNGLTMAALLAHHGVDCMVVERHGETSIQYKFAGISPRSMEIFRSIGLEDEIRSKRTGDQRGGAIGRGRNLSDPEIQWSGPAWPDTSGVSPTPPATCDQHVLEPILKHDAERHGAVMRFNAEFMTVEEADNAVHAHIRDRATGRDELVTARYIVAADGASGHLREQLGINRHGPGVLQHWMNIILDTDLPDTIGGTRFTSCFVSDINGTVTPRPGGRWLLALQYLPEKGERPEQFDADRCRELMERASGRADIRADLVDARAWEVAALVADSFSKGRCFLTGDCAHLMPPTGAFGGNTGIHDAHNLAWKLALVLRGRAGEALLESYDAERRPVAERSLAQSLARLQRWFKDPSNRLPPPVPLIEDYDVVFGQRYDQGAFLSDGQSPEHPFEPFRELAGRPGTRLPHMPLMHNARPISSLDLCGENFVLLATDPEWSQAAKALAAETGLPLAVRIIGTDGDVIDVENRWPSIMGTGHDGAVLVRPDGVVAWRTADQEPAAKQRLLDVLTQLGLQPVDRRGEASNLDRMRADLIDLAGRHRQEGDTLRKLPPALADAFLRHDIYRMLLPRDLEGADMDPLDYLQLIEDIARVDGSIAWNFAIGAGSVLYGGYLPVEHARTLFAKADCCIAGAYAPFGRGERVDGGFRVSGRWGWASGIDQARWVVFGFLVPPKDGAAKPEMVQGLAPRDAFRILDTWHVSGMLGTGSTEYEVEDLFVPTDMTFRMFIGKPQHSAPLFRLPGAFFGAVVASVTLGIALGAAENLRRLATAKQPFPGRSALREQAFAQYAVAKAQALAESASIYLRQATADIWEQILLDKEIDLEQRVRARRASVHAAEVSVEAVNLVCKAAGGSALFQSQPFERALRDVHAASAQIVLQRVMMEDAGRAAFGLDTVSTTF